MRSSSSLGLEFWYNWVDSSCQPNFCCFSRILILRRMVFLRQGCSLRDLFSNLCLKVSFCLSDFPSLNPVAGFGERARSLKLHSLHVCADMSSTCVRVSDLGFAKESKHRFAASGAAGDLLRTPKNDFVQRAMMIVLALERMSNTRGKLVTVGGRAHDVHV